MSETTDSKQIILSTGLKLFARKGFDAVSTMDIVAESGISKPTMYYYFGSKKGLLSEILEVHYTRFLNDLKQAIDIPEDIPRTVFKIIRVYFDYALNDRDFSVLKASFWRVSEDTAYSVATPYIDKEIKLIRAFFHVSAVRAGNLRGKEDNAAIGLVGIVVATIAAYFRTDNRELLSDESIYKLRQQFLYGIYS